MSIRSAACLLILACGVGVVLSTRLAPRTAMEWPQKQVGNFRLVDDRDHAFELYGQSDARAVVLISYQPRCAQLMRAFPTVEALLRRYPQRTVRCCFLDMQDDWMTLKRQAKRNALNIRYLRDDTQVVSRDLQFNYCPEVVAISPRTWKIVYRGALAEVGSQEIAGPLLRVLDALLAGREVTFASTDGSGCAMRYAQPADVSYTHAVAPILQDHCVQCHGANGVPALDKYEHIRKFAPMIRETLVTRRMPPDQLESALIPLYGNAMALRPDELRTLLQWIDGGAKYDKGVDPLLSWSRTVKRATHADAPDFEWRMAVPVSIAATGEQKYTYRQMAGPTTKDLWIRTIRIEPTNRDAIHHATVFVSSRPLAGFSSNILEHTYGDETWRHATFRIASLHPNQPDDADDNVTAWRIKRGSYFLLQIHYHGTGRVTHDRTAVRMWYVRGHAPAVPRHIILITNYFIRLPPQTHDVVLRNQRRIHNDLYILRVFPHMHLRGLSFKASLIRPDGRKQIFFSLPFYYFNFQKGFNLTKPLFVPRDSTVEIEGLFDNSATNPGVPNAGHAVTAGQATDDAEMFRFAMHVVYAKDLHPGDLSKLAGQRF